MNRTLLYAQKRAELSKQRIQIMQSKAKRRKASFRNALVVSLLTIFLSLSTAAGATYAWFTDSVSNTGNKIQAGTLKIDFLMSNTPTEDGYHSIANQSESIFSDNVIWEPGQTQYAYLAVENKGNLALKYNIILDVLDMATNLDPTSPMAGAFDVAIINQSSPTAITSWDDVKANSINLLNAIQAQIPGATSGRITAAANGVLDEIINGTTNERQYFAIAVHMKEDAGNAYQNGLINIDAVVVATQAPAEEDGFGNNSYDTEAQFDVVPEKRIVRPTTGAELENAIYGAHDGDIILLGNTTYTITNDSRLELVHKNVTIQGAGIGKTIIDCGTTKCGEAAMMVGADNVTLKDFTVKSSSTDVDLPALKVSGNYAGAGKVINDVHISNIEVYSLSSTALNVSDINGMAYVDNVKISQYSKFGIYFRCANGVISNCNVCQSSGVKDWKKNLAAEVSGSDTGFYTLQVLDNNNLSLKEGGYYLDYNNNRISDSVAKYTITVPSTWNGPITDETSTLWN